MALSFFLLMALGVLSCSSICCLGCDLPQSHSLANRRTLMLLGQMRRISPLYCLEDRKDFGFPQEELDGLKSLSAQAISVHHDLVQQIFNLFSIPSASAAWDKTLLDELCMELYQQLNGLEECLMQEMEGEESSLMNVHFGLAVKKYFQRIILYLKEKNYSPCAWEIVRAEIRRTFSASTSWQERPRSTEGDLVP